VLVGAVTIAAGAAWWAGGSDVLRSAITGATKVVPVLLLLVGLVAVMRVVAPPWALVGPVLVVLVGGLWLIIQKHSISEGDVRGALPVVLLLAGLAIAVPLPGSAIIGQSKIYDGTESVAAVIFGRRVQVLQAPSHLTVRVLATTLRVDVSTAQPPALGDQVEVDVFVLGGRLELLLPGSWRVMPGRLSSHRGVQFDGRSDAVGPLELVLNVRGFGGSVSVSRA
jgi:hypothetical protein